MTVAVGVVVGAEVVGVGGAAVVPVGVVTRSVPVVLGASARFDEASPSRPQPPMSAAYEHSRTEPSALNRPPRRVDDSGRAAMRLRIVHYDRVRHRVWILGQRWHHGATGALVAGLGVTRGSMVLAAAGSALMVHDWRDRALWFLPGAQSQA